MRNSTVFASNPGVAGQNVGLSGPASVARPRRARGALSAFFPAFFGVAVATLATLTIAPSAHAGFLVEGSVGKGLEVKPDQKATPTNIMIAPGFSLVSVLRLQLGFVGDLPDVKASKTDFGLRPMLTISPPLFPLYGRVIFAFDNLFHDSTRAFAYGAALGLSFGVGPIGIFAEAGLLPRRLDGQTLWNLEGRLGVSLGF